MNKSAMLDDNMLPIIALETLGNQIVDALSHEIISGRLQPGQRIDLNFYADRWNISITPVRDAARKLEALGLITILSRRGVFVATLDARDVKELFDVRIALESATVRLATPHIPTDEARQTRKLYIEAGEKLKAQPAEKHLSLPTVDLLIHKLALQYCDNSRLQKMMQEMWGLIEWCQNTVASQLQEPFLTTLPEHIAICDAIIAGDADAASAAMYQHLTLTSARIQSLLT